MFCFFWFVFQLAIEIPITYPNAFIIIVYLIQNLIAGPHLMMSVLGELKISGYIQNYLGAIF